VDIPFLDLGAQHRPLRDEILAAWARVLDSTAFVSGREVGAFEEEFAEACGVDQCVALSSGTDALVLALRALGVKRDDEVVIPANTFIATAEAVSIVGGRPRIVDCDDATANIDPGAAAAALDDGARAVVPVHLFGQPADMTPLGKAAASNGAIVLEDAAQAHLATYHGDRVGSLGATAAFSFYPGKNLGATGEGGAVTTADSALAEEIRMLRDHGQSAKYHSAVVGYNARMIELVAAALRIKLRHLPEWTEARRQVARWYRARLADVAQVQTQLEPEWASSSYHLFVVRVPQRDRVQEALTAAGVGSGLHYPVPVHLQPAYADLGHGPGAFPSAEAWASNGLSLPMYPELSEAQVDRVCDVLATAVATGAG
jgi:dTDP-4-amino-4,6-dideoxygalactose transaminase